MEGDFNGDGRDDLAVADQNVSGSDGSVVPGVDILLGNGDGTFQSRSSNLVGEEPDAAVSGAFTRSGHLDLVTSNEGSDDVSVLLGNGDGTFQPAISVPAGVDPIAIATGDFNDDARLDLAVADQGVFDPTVGETVGQGVTVLLGNGDGTFQPASTSFYPLSGTVQAIAAGDFDGDGKTDLAVAVDGSDPAHTGVYILRGDGLGDFQAPALYALGGDPVFPGSRRATSTATARPTWPSRTSWTTASPCSGVAAKGRSAPRYPTR